MIGWKLRRSAGVPVTRRVHAMIAAANAARDRHDWRDAAAKYERVLQADRSLSHIHLQFGHALKELDELDRAESAYLEARKRLPRSADPSLHLGHVSKLRGDERQAATHYLDAFRKNPSDPDAGVELHRVIGMSAGTARGEILNALRCEAGELSELAESIDTARAPAQRLDGRPTLMFDVSDLIAYYRHARLPTGIQRVQIETIAGALADGAHDRIGICCFVDGRDDWLEVPVTLFLAVIEASVRDDDRRDPGWVTLLNRLRLVLALSSPMTFPVGAYLITLGTSWWLQNYFLHVREAKKKSDIRYIPLIYDLIPIVAPQHCVPKLVQDFISWLLGVFDHAEYFFAISAATKADLVRVAHQLGHELDPDRVKVIRLDANFRKPSQAVRESVRLPAPVLDQGNFVLFVSTIESRKNHVLAFDAWARLIEHHGERHVPYLVCVGRRGWLNEAVYERLQHDGPLRAKVIMLSGVADEQLARLYESCLFTLYPSLYEGWGLPVTESLCYGKVPVISDSSSLPEAGGEDAVYFRSGSLSELAALLERMIFEPAFREARENAIATRFAPRTWRDIGDEITTQVADWARSGLGDVKLVAPTIRLGQYFALRRNVETRIWKGLAQAEIYRSGLGWQWPDAEGCRTRPGGGKLRLPLPPSDNGIRLYLRLRGLATRDSEYLIALEAGHEARRGWLQRNVTSWVALDMPPSEGPHSVTLLISGSETEESGLTNEGAPGGLASIALLGFFACAKDDAATRSEFVEAVALNNIDSLDAYRSPDSSDGYSVGMTFNNRR